MSRVNSLRVDHSIGSAPSLRGLSRSAKLGMLLHRRRDTLTTVHEYLRVQLQGFKAGVRFDMDGNMTSAAQPLSAADIDRLAAYISGLP